MNRNDFAKKMGLLLMIKVAVRGSFFMGDEKGIAELGLMY